MKILILITTIFISLQATASDNVQTKMIIDNSQLCIKSYSRKKCATDSLTKKQVKKMNSKIESIQNQIPPHIMNDTLNHFWANHHKYSSSQLLSIFDKSKNPQCISQINVQKKRSKTIEKKILTYKKVLNSMDKEVAQSCMSPNIAKKLYR